MLLSNLMLLDTGYYSDVFIITHAFAPMIFLSHLYTQYYAGQSKRSGVTIFSICLLFMCIFMYRHARACPKG
jgi:hypothetical protein